MRVVLAMAEFVGESALVLAKCLDVPKRHMKALVASPRRSGPVDRMYVLAFGTQHQGCDTLGLKVVGTSLLELAVDAKEAEKDLGG